MISVKLWSLGEGGTTHKVICVYYVDLSEIKIEEMRSRISIFKNSTKMSTSSLKLVHLYECPILTEPLVSSEENKNHLALPFLVLCPLLFIACVHTGNFVCSGVYRLVNW